MDPQKPQHDSKLTSADKDRRNFLAGAAALGAAVATAACAPMESKTSASGMAVKSPKTNDGVKLNFIEKGKGKPIVMIPGWSQTAAMYKHQLDGLSSKYRVIALDMRGHGDSDKPQHGYRIARLADDLHDFLHDMRLENVALAGHSMGCSVIWSYWDNYGGDHISKLILIDQAPTVTAWPGWTDAQKQEAGALFDPKALYETAAALSGPEGDKATANLVNNLFFTKSYPKDQLAWVLAENMKFPRPLAAKLLVDHCMQDWRDTIPRINVPTLVFGGKASFFHPKSQEWIAKQIPNAQLSIFEAEEGGSHFMFMENAAKFNGIVEKFMG